MKEIILRNFAEILDIEEGSLNVTDSFRDYPEWDSIANLSVIAMIDDEFGVVIDNNDFKQLQTIQEIMDFISRKKA